MKSALTLLAAGLLVLAVALPAVANPVDEPEPGPPGPYQGNKNTTEVETCHSYPGDTTYAWSHLRCSFVKIFWVDEAYDEIASTDEIPCSMRPFGTITVPTPEGAWRMGTIVGPWGGGVTEYCVPE